MPDQKNIGSSTAKEEATTSPKGQVGQASLHREVENFPRHSTTSRQRRDGLPEDQYVLRTWNFDVVPRREHDRRTFHRGVKSV